MKYLAIAFLASGALLASASAGSVTLDNKDYKAPAPTLCFDAHEWQFDLFGEYAVGEGPHQAAIFRDHGWGGGLGLNYFFTRNLGIGADASWLDATEAPRRGHHASRQDTVGSYTGSVIYRMPIDSLCLAPYVYAGGGASTDGEDWASAHVGAGVEYRIKPQKFGVFLDARWTYYGDRFDHDDLNNFSTRLGFRVIF